MNENRDEIKDKIRQRFVTVALDPKAPQRHPTGPESAKRLGYDPAAIDRLPDSVTESFAGVGNPLSLGDFQLGEAILDLGCGAGVDSLLAAQKVGPRGRVLGVDMTAEMVEKARANAAVSGITNATFYNGEADQIPVADGSVDVVITNGVLNLCFDKPKVLAEVYRVLKPGGRLQMADILLGADVPESDVEQKGVWSD